MSRHQTDRLVDALYKDLDKALTCVSRSCDGVGGGGAVLLHASVKTHTGKQTELFHHGAVSDCALQRWSK